MPRVKIEDLKPDARELEEKEMKKLFGGFTDRNLSGVVSQYIEETKTNLNRTFGAVENASALVFLDEADDLFGKR